jgi:hypothetical protein
MVTALDGRVLSSSGDVRAFFNCSPSAMHGRELYLFIEKERLQIKGSIEAVAPNVTIERDVMMRPRERKPLLARVTVTRAEDDQTIYWKFGTI